MTFKRIKSLATAFLLLITANSFAQTISTKYEATGVYGNGEYTPFWHMSNRQGLSSHQNSLFYTRLGVEGNNRFSNKKIVLDWGADVIGGYNLASAINIFKCPVYIQQAYFDFQWKRLRVSLGQKERWGELSNHRLSTGSLVESGNARPIPQIRIELPEYWNIPGTKGLLGIKGHLAYGWFTDGKWQEEFFCATSPRSEKTLYHSKAGFMRFGNEEKFPLTAEIGLHMVTQFGGNCYNTNRRPGVHFENPVRFKDFFYALIPLSGDASYDVGDQANVAGNMLGSWQGAITWNDKKWKLHTYYEHTFEDHSQLFWEYGLWTEQLLGLELELKQFPWIKNIVFEYFNLKNQSGPIYHDKNSKFPDQISCVDNNYNHGKYPGWFNYGQMIATPLCTSPIYNTDRIQYCYNNRTEAFHFGIEGEALTWLGYRTLYTRSNNWGSYRVPFKDIKINRSFLFELTFHPQVMKNWSITASFALDNGNLYGNNCGGMLTVKGCNIFKTGKKRQ
ncbi:MAG: hypothetical protein J6Q73_01900 [Bacteroidaceae bacterium]|nr:hypothetical protein [Bacteroidaceae bacterium]